MKVALLSFTENALKVAYTAARTCYSADSPIEIFNKSISDTAKEEKMLRLLNTVYQSGHHSVFEHINFVFAIQGISRACSHQLVRHRIASFSQQSQRYVSFGDNSFDHVIPSGIEGNKETGEAFRSAIQELHTVYKKLMDKGIAPEDARFVLPNAAATNIVMTVNFRELAHICSIRLCKRAQWEILDLFTQVKKLVKEKNPFLGDLLRPRCDELGYCPEHKSCGRHREKEKK